VLDGIKARFEKNPERYAAVIIEPLIQGAAGMRMMRPVFLQKLRELTKQYGIFLIFDEVITGFRLSLQSAQGKFGVTPDLTTLAKAVGGGFPVAVYGGKTEIMDLLADGTVFRAGTVNANRVAMGAACATLEILEEDNGKVYDDVYRKGEKLMRGMEEIFHRNQIQAILTGFGIMFQIHFTQLERIRNYSDFCQSKEDIFMDFRNRMLTRGIFIRPSHFGELYMSIAHSDEDIDKTLEAADDVIKEMKKEKVF